MVELEEGVKAHIKDEKPKNEVFAHPLPFNVIPHIDAFQDNGYTKEEMKVVWETQKIFGADIACSCTSVRIPTFRAHAEAITIETEKDVTPEAARGAEGGAGRAGGRRPRGPAVPDAAHSIWEVRRGGGPYQVLPHLRAQGPRHLRVRGPAAPRRRPQRGPDRREEAHGGHLMRPARVG